MSKLAIIPARGGSKRIPKKNIKPFLGIPIIEYSINAAINSKLFDEVMVSTDDKEIEEIALSRGAKVPFIRSTKNSDDIAILADVIKEVIEEYALIGKTFDYVCCLLPTAPFVNGELISQGFKKLIEGNLDSVFPVVKYSYPIQRALMFKDEKIQMLNDAFLNTRSQDLRPRFHDSGQFYWIKVSSFMHNIKLFTSNSSAIEISELCAQDIDTDIDWKLAELKYKLLRDDKKTDF